MKFQLLDSRKIFWLLFLICVGLRVYLYFSTYIIARDSVLYIAMTDLFLQGRFLEAIVYPPPLYPFLMAVMRLIISNPEIAGKLVSLLLGICTFFPLYYLGKRIFEQKVVFIGLLIFALHPSLVRFSAEVLSESTFFFLSIVGFWMLWKGWEEKRYLFCFLAGVILGLSCLTRAQGIFWIVVVLAIPIVFSFLKKGEEVDKQNLWKSFLIAIFGFFLIIFPYSYMLQSISGEWTVRQHTSWAILWGTGIPYDLDQSFWEALLILIRHPLLLVKKLVWNMGEVISLLPETIYYPFLFFLVVGLVIRNHTERHLKGELYLAIICLMYIFGHLLLYVTDRYLFSIVPFVIFWAGLGFWITVSWTHSFFKRFIPKLLEHKRALLVTVFLICLTAGGTLPVTLQPHRLDKRDIKELGYMIAALSQKQLVILASDARIGFYAKGVIVSLGSVSAPDVKNFTEFLEYAHNNNVDIIVMNKKRVVEENKIGALTRDFFAHADHPDLELLFVYPPEDQRGNQHGTSIFYVYRLVGKNSAMINLMSFEKTSSRKNTGIMGWKL